jgi:NAD(P)-dependent dehydrogenase (short-subunit alcohol dehydrogenase family)
MSGRLAKQRILIIGASSGIGRATGLMLTGEGARVAFAARRGDMLEETAAEAGNDSIAVACDVRDPDQCESVVAATVEQFGGLDGLVYATGIYPPSAMSNVDADEWRRILETNLVGASLVTRAAISHLKASPRGRAAYLSSISASLTPPWMGLGAYGVSKLGLERVVDAWRGENPEVGFTNIVVGNTSVNEQPANPAPDTPPAAPGAIDQALTEKMTERWTNKGYFSGEFMHADGVAEQVLHALTSRECVWSLTVLGRGWVAA